MCVPGRPHLRPLPPARSALPSWKCGVVLLPYGARWRRGAWWSWCGPWRAMVHRGRALTECVPRCPRRQLILRRVYTCAAPTAPIFEPNAERAVENVSKLYDDVTKRGTRKTQNSQCTLRIILVWYQPWIRQPATISFYATLLTTIRIHYVADSYLFRILSVYLHTDFYYLFLFSHQVSISNITCTTKCVAQCSSAITCHLDKFDWSFYNDEH